MPLNGQSRRANIALFSALCVLGIALTYFEVRGVFPSPVGTILPFVYLGVLFFFIRSRVARPPQEDHVVRGRSRAADIIKSALCMAAAVIWILGAASFVSDTTAGDTVLLVPFFLILGTGAYFFSRGISRRPR